MIILHPSSLLDRKAMTPTLNEGVNLYQPKPSVREATADNHTALSEGRPRKWVGLNSQKFNPIVVSLGRGGAKQDAIWG